MEKKDSKKAQDIKNQTFENKNLKSSINKNNKKDKPLPWWVEILFVQIGLPDKLLIKILKTKKIVSEIVKTEKKSLIFFLFIFTSLAYLFPIVKYSKTKLDCQNIANNYIRENKNLSTIKRKELRMLSTNFCNGGSEIYEIENK